MNDRIDAAVHLIDPGEGFHDLPVVGEIGPDEPGPGVGGRGAVEVHHRPALFDQCGDDGAAKLAAAAGHCGCAIYS